jgi:rubrerythrin
MISNTNPLDMSRILKDKDTLDQELLRLSIVAEIDAVNLYEQIAHMTENPEIKRVMLDVAKEEKTHVGEFQAMLLKLDREQKEELRHGEIEVEEMLLEAKEPLK